MDRILAITGFLSVICLLSTPVQADRPHNMQSFGHAHDLHLMTPHSVVQELAVDRFLNAGRSNGNRVAANQTATGLKWRSEPLERLIGRLRSSSKAARIADRLLGGRDGGFRLKVDPGDEEIYLMWRASLR